MRFFPYPPLYLLFFLLLIAILLGLVQLGLIKYVYERLGLSRRAALMVLLAAVLGSGINIPIARLPAERFVVPEVVSFYGIQYVVPQVVERGSTVLAVNVGGAVIPVLLALGVILQTGLTVRLLVAVAAVTALMHAWAQPVPGVGIALPPIMPAVLTALIAYFADRQEAPRVAFVAGTLGTLLGADILNLGIIRELGAPVVSIGGAGTFDGVFLIGVIAVLLAGIARPPRPVPRRDPGLG
jgi:uncharacterized membrane protein